MTPIACRGIHNDADAFSAIGRGSRGGRSRSIRRHSNLAFFLALQESVEARERPVFGGRLLVASGSTRAIEKPPVLVLVTVGTKQLPVAAIRRIIVMVVVPVVDLEKLHIRAVEFPGASTADPRIHLQSLFSVIPLAPLARAACLCDHPVQPGIVWSAVLGRHARLPRALSVQPLIQHRSANTKHTYRLELMNIAARAAARQRQRQRRPHESCARLTRRSNCRTLREHFL